MRDPDICFRHGEKGFYGEGGMVTGMGVGTRFGGATIGSRVQHWFCLGSYPGVGYAVGGAEVTPTASGWGVATEG